MKFLHKNIYLVLWASRIGRLQESSTGGNMHSILTFIFFSFLMGCGDSEEDTSGDTGADTASEETTEE